MKLALSLHAPTNFKRDQLVPLNKKYSIEEILNAVKIYQRKTGNRVTIEYVLIRGINDEISDAKKLAEILKNMKIFVNLIPVNPTAEDLKNHRENDFWPSRGYCWKTESKQKSDGKKVATSKRPVVS